MLTIRKADERGRADFGWLDSRHTFSFGQYHDPRHMGFGALRVINDDRVAGGRGFDTHPHANMEIVSYVLDGAMAHKDSLGTGAVIRPGDVQRMTAGTGIRHSEYNASETDPVHFLQIWIVPERTGLTPGYEQKAFAPDDKRGRLLLVGSRDGRDGSITIHQDVNLYATLLPKGTSVSHEVAAGRAAWVHIATGSATIDSKTVAAGAGVSVTGPTLITLTGSGEAEADVLVFDLGTTALPQH